MNGSYGGFSSAGGTACSVGGHRKQSVVLFDFIFDVILPGKRCPLSDDYTVVGQTVLLVIQTAKIKRYFSTVFINLPSMWKQI